VFLWNVGNHLQDHMVSQLWIRLLTYSSLWKSQISDTELWNLWAAFLPTWLTCTSQGSHVSRFTRRYHAVLTHCIGSPKKWTGLISGCIS
jgi:hypothetical protein